MTNTLPGIQVTHRCAWHDGTGLCSDPAPYLIRGTSYCPLHALQAVENLRAPSIGRNAL